MFSRQWRAIPYFSSMRTQNWRSLGEFVERRWWRWRWFAGARRRRSWRRSDYRMSTNSRVSRRGVISPCKVKIMAMTKMTTVSGEAGLAQILLDDGRIQLSHYGHLVAYGLNKVGDHYHNHRLSLCGSMQWWFCQEKTNWVTYNLAGLYWRMKGDAFESIECLRYFDTIYPPIIIDYHQFQIPWVWMWL